MNSWISQLRKGMVELTVLAALRDREAYGYELLQRLNAIEGLALTESNVYPLLARLTREGVLKVRAAPSPSGPPRRYYRLTSQGHIRLREMTEHWRQIRSAIDHLLEGGGP